MAGSFNPYPGSPASSTQYVNDFDVQAANNARRRKLADLLQQQAMQGSQSVSPGVPMSVAQPLADIFEAFAANRMHANQDVKDQELLKQRDTAFNDQLAAMPQDKPAQEMGPPAPDPTQSFTGQDGQAINFGGASGPGAMSQQPAQPVSPRDWIQWGANIGKTSPLGQKIGEQATARGLAQLLPDQTKFGKWTPIHTFDANGRPQQGVTNEMIPGSFIPVGGPQATAMDQARQLATELYTEQQRPGGGDRNKIGALTIALKAINATPDALGGVNVTNLTAAALPGGAPVPQPPVQQPQPAMQPPPMIPTQQPGAQPPGAAPQAPSMMPNPALLQALQNSPPMSADQSIKTTGDGIPYVANADGTGAKASPEVQAALGAAQQAMPSTAPQPSPTMLPATKVPQDDRPQGLGTRTIAPGITHTDSSARAPKVEPFGYDSAGKLVQKGDNGLFYYVGSDANHNPTFTEYKGDAASLTPPAAMEKQVDDSVKLAGGIEQTKTLLRAVQDNPGAFGVKSIPNNLPMGIGAQYQQHVFTPQEIKAQTVVATQTAQVLHALYGSALSAGEQARAAKFLPRDGDTPEILKAKLESAMEWAQSEQGKIATASYIAGLDRRNKGSSAAGGDGWAVVGRKG